jgi:Flp pilus assembly protein TadG
MIKTKPVKASEPSQRRLGRLGDAGGAALELGLCAPLLMGLILGVVEIGTAMNSSMQVHNAVEAGMVYAAKYGWNSAGISAAVVNATGAKNLTATPAPTQYCGCPSTTGIATAACGAKCADGKPVGLYIQINAAVPHATILPGLSLPSTLTAKSVFRLS